MDKKLLDRLERISGIANDGWWSAQNNSDWRMKDLFESIRFHLEKIKEENDLDESWRPIITIKMA